MPQTKVIIVYSPSQNKRRTVIIPDDDSQVNIHATNIAKGEAVFIGSLLDYQTIGPDAMLIAHTNQQASSDRYAIIDGVGNVVLMALLDPLIDIIPQGYIAIQDSQKQLMVGATFVNGIVTLPTPIIDQTSNSVIGFIPVSQSIKLNTI